MKSFPYPLQPTDLANFLDPDGGQPLLWEDGYTYYRCEWWTLRTSQFVDGAAQAITCPISEETAKAFDSFPPDTDKDSHDLHDIQRILHKYPARIWERTQFRHHLQSYPLVKVGHHLTIQKGILQLASKLPRARIYAGTNCSSPRITFTKGQLILHTLPSHITSGKIALRFFGPKDRHPMDR